ncbi:MAG: RAMP superfamily CRISPR-associated protein [Eubacteriales bacterium]|nr:RAMP superfamily CRISPR-associated protein [Eubacteriales bacterium]
MKNPIRKRCYYAAEVTLCSPLSVSSGMNEYTDSDVLVNGSGEVFVPGTSLAGAMRGYLGMDKKTDGIFGFSDGEDGKMSRVAVCDLYFDRKSVVSVRDGVQLNEWKNVQNKFDMEIVETGARGTLYLNYTMRGTDKKEDYEEEIASIFQAIQKGTIRIGANKNRGFGRLKLGAVYQKSFSQEDGRKIDIEEWVNFKKNFRDTKLYEKKSYEEWAKGKEQVPERYVKVTVPLRLKGGISIRRYSARPQEADFEHITCASMPVIPGTSWNGAIRADIRTILYSIGKTEAQTAELIKQWFGYVPLKKNEASEQSMVVIGESRIEEAAAVPMTRNRINRFDASTKDGALYSEIAYFGGRTELEIMVKKDESKAYHALIGILSLVIADIQDGYVAVGGQTAVGRGIFSADPERHIQYSEAVSIETCLKELYSL